MEELLRKIPQFSNAEILSSEKVQNLWNNYGEIRRIFLKNQSFIVKFIDPPEECQKTTDYDRKIRFL